MYVTHSSLNGVEPAGEAIESGADLMAKLMGDWSWRPNMQPHDPGYVYTAADIEAVEFQRTLREMGAPRAKLQALRPWMVRAYDGKDLAFKPVRIGPRT
jgi:hypothetical protein